MNVIICLLFQTKDKVKMEYLFCYKVVPEHEYANLYQSMLGIYRPKDMLLIDNMICPGCENENCFVDTKDKKNYFCLFCHYTEKKELFSSCHGCGVIYYDNVQDDGSFQCSSCWERFKEKLAQE